MKVVYFDKETSEHITISNVWKIEEVSENNVKYEKGIKVYYYEDANRIVKKGAYIPERYVTSITLN